MALEGFLMLQQATQLPGAAGRTIENFLLGQPAQIDLGYLAFSLC